MIAGKISVTITKTSDGQGDYVQLMSDDMLSVNVVLVAREIVLKDTRPPKHANRLASTRAYLLDKPVRR